MTDIKWTNERRRVKDLVPWDKNPRKITDEQLDHLKRSIEKFNYAAPIVIDADGRIVAGHMRTRALLALGRGEEELDVRVASRALTTEEFEELAIRDNQNGGGWDWEAMQQFDRDMLTQLGFDEAELLKNLGLEQARQNTVEPERMDVLVVNPPEAARLRERCAFHFETMEEYREACAFFGVGDSVALDHKKLLEIIRRMNVPNAT